MLLLRVLLTSQPVLLERPLASQSLRVWPGAQSQRYRSAFYCLWSRYCYLFMRPEGQGPYPPGMDLGTRVHLASRHRHTHLSASRAASA